MGLDTFRPVQEDNPQEHRIHREYGFMSEEVARALSLAKKKAGVLSVSAPPACDWWKQLLKPAAVVSLRPFEGWVDLFILPGHQFNVVDAMITNFHLPKSTLLMLVSAFTGKELIDKAYQIAIAEKYRFYSFGDAMLIL